MKTPRPRFPLPSSLFPVLTISVLLVAGSSVLGEEGAAAPLATPRAPPTPFFCVFFCFFVVAPGLQEKLSWLLVEKKELSIQVQELQRQNRDLQEQVWGQPPPQDPLCPPPRGSEPPQHLPFFPSPPAPC